MISGITDLSAQPQERCSRLRHTRHGNTTKTLFLKVNQAFLCNAHTIPFIPKTMGGDGLAGSGSNLQ